MTAGEIARRFAASVPIPIINTFHMGIWLAIEDKQPGGLVGSPAGIG